MPRSKAEYRAALRKRCDTLHGHGPQNPADFLEEIATWCRDNAITFDQYGNSALLQRFEAKIKETLGFEAARFMPSGTMAQPIALKIWSERQKLDHIGMHPTSHVELHEHRGYAHLYGLRATLVGPQDSPLLAKHLEALKEPISTLLIELPTREAGGQLPTWDELEALKACARERNIRLHLDGARLWECAPWFKRSYAEICAGFDSCYVSFYKGIGGLAGAMLLGPADFIDAATLWQRRAGGNLPNLTVNVASAAMRFDAQIAKIPHYHARAVSLAATLAPLEGLRVLPNPPHTNMMHLFFPFTPEILLEARDRVAEETSILALSYARPTGVPGISYTELYIGDAALKHNDETLGHAFSRLMTIASELQNAPDHP